MGIEDTPGILQRISSLGPWHYAFDIGEHRVEPANAELAEWHQRRRATYFGQFLRTQGGSLAGQRVLDLGCNAGFWSIAAIEAGCSYVLGVDGRARNIEQAEFIFYHKMIDNNRYRFVVDDALGMSAEEYGKFDTVFCLGLLYHTKNPVALFERLHALTTGSVLIDTNVALGAEPAFHLFHDDVSEPTSALADHIVMWPTRSAVISLGRMFFEEVMELGPAVSSPSWVFDDHDGERQAFLCRGPKSTSRNPISGVTTP